LKFSLQNIGKNNEKSTIMQKSLTPFLLMLWILTFTFFCQLGCKPKAKPILPNGSVGFFEVYNFDEIEPNLIKANNTLAKILDSINTYNSEKEPNAKGKRDSLEVVDRSISIKFPITKFFVYDGYVRDNKGQTVPDLKTGKPSYHSEIGGVLARDTSILIKYLHMPEIMDMFPEGIKFIFGSSIYETDKNGKKTNIVGLYALKTMNIPGGAKLKGNHITYVGPDYDEQGRTAIEIKLDAEGGRIFSKLTRDNIGLPIAIVLNEYVCTAPKILGEINGGNLQISGNYSAEAIDNLADEIKSAASADKKLYH
jgi:hypothetical protein